MDDNWGTPMTQGGTWINVISLQMLEGLWMIRLWKKHRICVIREQQPQNVRSSQVAV